MNRVDSEKALYSEVKVAVGARLGGVSSLIIPWQW